MVDAKTYKEFRYKSIQLRPLFYLQEKLDNVILARLEVDEDILVEIRRKKVLSFRVELAEILNELRTHKYWSQKLPSPREVLLEEYVDGLHFLLSIGIDKGVKDYTYKGVYDKGLTADNLIYMFEALMTTPWQELTKSEYCSGLEMYIRLGFVLLFSWDEISEAYVEKNLKNHERQLEGY